MWTWTQIHFGNFSCQPHLLIKSVKGEDAVEPLVIRYSLEKWIYWSPIVKRYPNILPFKTSWKIKLFSANVQILNFDLCDVFHPEIYKLYPWGKVLIL